MFHIKMRAFLIILAYAEFMSGQSFVRKKIQILEKRKKNVATL